ncbi:hypothetical protein HOL34_01235 [bacterium]|nr:hypothetical protein [bacterium]MBT5345698.1 hypothetical protein [bacterium]MBT6130655.1 hypothetical protein [bacterium]MBT6528710.1 hypothetical protein [bacterium]
MKNSIKIILLTIIIPTAALGGIHSGSSLDWFRKQITKHFMTVPMFYRYSLKGLKGEAKKRARKMNSDQQALFKHVSKVDSFKDAGVRFIKVDLGKKRAKALEERYKLERKPAESQPTYTTMIFHDGVPVTDEQEEPVKITNPGNDAHLRSFVERHLGEQVNAKLVEKEKRKREQRQARVLFASQSYHPWYGYGGPYYGRYAWNPGYYGPGFGFAHHSGYVW